MRQGDMKGRNAYGRLALVASLMRPGDEMNRDSLLTQAYDIGYEHGKNAGSWVFDGNTDQATYERYAKGLEDGDPEILDTLPNSPLSGEWADGPTPTSVLSDLGLENNDNMGEYDYLLDAYEQGFGEGCNNEIERVLAIQLEEDQEELLKAAGTWECQIHPGRTHEMGGDACRQYALEQQVDES
jgi:hypothetical protein